MDFDEYRLPESEWDFTKAVEKYGVNLVFLYEYARTACQNHNGGDFLRLTKVAQAVCSQVNSLWNDVGMDTIEKRIAARKIIRNHHLASFLEFALPLKTGFPDKPLIDDDSRKFYEVSLINWSNQKAYPLGFRNPQYVQRCEWTNEIGEEYGKGEDYKERCISKSYPHALGEPQCPPEGATWVAPDCYRPLDGQMYSDVGLVTASFIEVNWAFSDSEIRRAFEKFLLENRPPRFRLSVDKAPQKKGKKVRGKHEYANNQIGTNGELLSFDRGLEDGALAWLSIYRKKNAAGLWPQYFERYHAGLPQKEIERLTENLKGSYDKADAIIEWFIKGGRLEKMSNGGLRQRSVQKWE